MSERLFENSPAFEGWDDYADTAISPDREGRKLLSSARGLRACRSLKPSVETLGYVESEAPGIIVS